MDVIELDAITKKSLTSQNTEESEYIAEIDSDGDVRPNLGFSSSEDEDKAKETKFVNRVKRRTLRRKTRMDRQRRGQGMVWSAKNMDHWLATPEDDPEPGRSDESLTDSAEGESLDYSDEPNYREPSATRQAPDFCRDLTKPT